MRIIIILTLVAAFVGLVAIPRYKHLSELKEENHRLDQSNARQGPTSRSERPDSGGNVSNEFIERIREAMITFSSGDGKPVPMEEKEANQLMQSMRELSADDIANLVAGIMTDSRMAGIGEEKIHQICQGTFATLAPCSWWEYLAAHRDLPGWQNLLGQTCEGCLRENGRRALQLMDLEEAAGNPVVPTTNIRRGVLHALAVSDPDKMLEKAASPEYVADPDALRNLGGNVTDRFENQEDHRHFLAALRRSQEKDPSDLVTNIRKDYMKGMSHQWMRWPAADAIDLMNSEFSPDECLFVADEIAGLSDLTDPVVWEDWFLKIDPTAWSEWAKRKPNPHQQLFIHPLVRQVESLAIKDSQKSSRLLEKIPQGALRDQAILAVAWQIVEREPDLAGKHAEELPDSKGKEELLKRVGEIKR